MTYPTAAVTTTNLDAGTDSPASARSDLLDAVQKLNQMIAHTTAFAATLLDDANAAAALATLGAAASGANADITGLSGLSGVVGIQTAGYSLVSPLQLGRVYSFTHDINNGYIGAGWAGLTPGSAVYAVSGANAVRETFDSATGAISWQFGAAGPSAGAPVTFTDKMHLSSAGVLTVGGSAATTLTDFPNSLAGSGFQFFPGGLVIQWGIGTAASAVSGTSTSITFPTTYPSGPYTVVAGPTGTAAGNSTFNVTALSSTGFTVQRGNNGNIESGTQFHWFSIGI